MRLIRVDCLISMNQVSLENMAVFQEMKEDIQIQFQQEWWIELQLHELNMASFEVLLLLLQGVLYKMRWNLWWRPVYKHSLKRSPKRRISK